MSYFFGIQDRNKTYTVGMHGAPGLNTLTDEYLRQYGLPASRRDDYMTSLERLRQRTVDVFIGAHPGQNDTLGKRTRITGEENPFVDPTAWPAFLQDLSEAAREAFGTG
jgi:hypothetical protein